MSAISTIRNLGPKTQAEFAKAGIETAEHLRALGADSAYAQLLQHGTRPHFIGYYVLVLGLQGRKWTDITPAEKAALRENFDRLVDLHKQKDRPEIEAALDRLGVGRNR